MPRTKAEEFKIFLLMILTLALAIVGFTTWKNSADEKNLRNGIERMNAIIVEDAKRLYEPFTDPTINIPQMDEGLIAGFTSGDGPVVPTFLSVIPIHTVEGFKIGLSIHAYENFTSDLEHTLNLNEMERWFKREKSKANADYRIKIITWKMMLESKHEETKKQFERLPFENYRDYSKIDNKKKHLLLSLSDAESLIENLRSTLDWPKTVTDEGLNVTSRAITDMKRIWSPSGLRSFKIPSEGKSGALSISDFDTDLTREKQRLSSYPNRTRLSSPTMNELASGLYNSFSVEYSDSPSTVPIYSFEFYNSIKPSASASYLKKSIFSTEDSSSIQKEPEPELLRSGDNFVISLDLDGVMRLIGFLEQTIQLCSELQVDIDEAAYRNEVEKIEAALKEGEAKAAQAAEQERIEQLLTLNAHDEGSKVSARQPESSFPHPPNFTDLKAISLDIHRYFVEGYDDGINKMIAAFIPDGHAEKIAQGIAPSLGKRQLNVKTKKGIPRKVTIADFIKEKAELKQTYQSTDKMQTVLETADEPAFDNLQRSYPSWIQKDDGMVDQPRYYPIHDEGSRHISMSVNNSSIIGGERQNLTMTMTLMLYNKEILLLSVISEQGEGNLEWTRKTMHDWVEILLGQSAE